MPTQYPITQVQPPASTGQVGRQGGSRTPPCWGKPGGGGVRTRRRRSEQVSSYGAAGGVFSRSSCVPATKLPEGFGGQRAHTSVFVLKRVAPADRCVEEGSASFLWNAGRRLGWVLRALRAPSRLPCPAGGRTRGPRRSRVSERGRAPGTLESQVYKGHNRSLPAPASGRGESAHATPPRVWNGVPKLRRKSTIGRGS